MLWLFANYSNEFSFYQIYNELTEGIVFETDGNIIYSLNCLTDNICSNLNSNTNSDSDSDSDPDTNTNYNSDKFLIYIFDVKIKDNLISFENKSTNIIETFVFKTFVCEHNQIQNQIQNQIRISTQIPIFKYIYIKVKNTRMPNLSNELYDYTSTIEFKIDKIQNNLLFIQEHNLLTNEFKQYYITDKLK